MKKWSGGTLILALAMILVLRYSFMESHPQKQSPFGFFKDLSENGTRLEGNDISRPAQLPEILEHSKRPRLISVEGVDGLYSWSDISEAESRVKLVWSQMQHLISRSDSLPETAQGVKEASIAWKDLVATLEKEKSLSAINNSLYLNDTEDQNCPFSFSVLNSTSLTNGSLKFPCGLVQDSSISIVGIPTEHNGSFQIELVGSQLPGELDSPVILHYNVSLQGDSLMRDPVILQNTWTADHGWGVEERCPANAASGNTKVDGLVRCNEQVGGTIRDETVNGSQLSSRKLLVSKGSGHISYSFPFVEGHPFTATLWVGVDGFHMTVNGRHETSFAYREHKNGQVNVELWKEAQRYGDIQLMPFVDYYSLITLKTIAICFFGTKILPAKYIMKTDDDAFVRIDQVLSILKEKKVSDGLLYGLISFDSTPHRDKDSKWYISEKEWPHASYPPWAHGPGYIISRDIAKFIVQGHQERNLKLFKLEDVAMGIWVEQYKKRGRKVHYMTDDRFHNAGCESDYILAHYQGPRLMLCLWEKLQKEHQPICCE
ncbi:hydroxyproline O-galactosyltransferase GALT3-like isoform X2 [Magnolia sinica]|uniref:hydroxyproline O-galactosyltransferase GALT3-like isoform X2 n=1 Tax=Magnolia sinica TaxID=86752 RepID=UPI0026587B4C|nr:hydroxyproline O-galactosyltransferase GALT3-like isoform X2 [Magnolia sinica]